MLAQSFAVISFTSWRISRAYLPASAEFLLFLSCMFIPGFEGSDHDPGVAQSPTIHGNGNYSKFVREAVSMGDFESFSDSNFQKVVLWFN